MGFAHGWFRMTLECYLGVIPMFCFEILRIFGEKSQKSKTRNLGISGSYVAA